MQRVDRGLSSELVKSPINPSFLFMSVPLLDGYNPLFYVQLNGEALWEWRSLRNPSQLFETLQDNLSRIAGYRLSSSSRTRFGTAVYSTYHLDYQPSTSTIKITVLVFYCSASKRNYSWSRRGYKRAEKERRITDARKSKTKNWTRG